MNKNQETSNETKNSLIQAFCILYQKKPIEKISIRELTTIAGYNRTTFYHHFCDIYDLLEHIEDTAIKYVKKSIVNGIKGDNPSSEFIKTFLDIHDKWESYLSILLMNQNSVKFIDKLKQEIFYECMEAFNLPKNNIRASYILDFYLSAVISFITKWIKNKDLLSCEEMAELLNDMLTSDITSKINNFNKKRLSTG